MERKVWIAKIESGSLIIRLPEVVYIRHTAKREKTIAYIVKTGLRGNASPFLLSFSCRRKRT
jgi:hypothetical protein